MGEAGVPGRNGISFAPAMSEKLLEASVELAVCGKVGRVIIRSSLDLRQEGLVHPGKGT